MTRSEFIIRWLRQPVAKTNCFYCGRPFCHNSDHSPNRKTLEHIVPRRDYRGRRVSFKNNIVNACAGCNNAKNGSYIREFRKWYGRQFFCEILLHENFPYEDNSSEGNGTRDFGFDLMIEQSIQKLLRENDARFERLRKKLKRDFQQYADRDFQQYARTVS